jgi:hypothetical protein
MVVVNGKELKEYDDIAGPMLYSALPNISVFFSPDSKHLTYVAYNAQTKSKCVVLDGKESNPYYDIIGDLQFSSDSKHLLYQAQIIINSKTDPRKKNLAVIDAEEYTKYEQNESITLSPDTKLIAYKATQDNQSFVVLNGQEGTKYDRIISPIIFDSNTQFHYQAMKMNDIYLIEETVEFPSFLR